MQGQKHNAKKNTWKMKTMQGQKHDAKKNTHTTEKCKKWKGKNTAQKKNTWTMQKKQVQKHNAKQCKSRMQKMQAHTKKVDVKTANKKNLDAM